MSKLLKPIFRKLFERRNPSFPAIYGVAGFMLLLLGLFGMQYGAAFFFWPLALICFSLVVYPTLFFWLLITGAFSAAAIVYIGFTIFELISKGAESTIYSDGLIVYFIYITIIIAISLGLIMAKPSLIRDETGR